MKRRRSQQSGYALLMVFLLAAVVSITLYSEMPRVAFESQRTKEQLLIDRGEQYKRAIQLFYRKNKRFPTTMEELEKFQEIRYLRQKYKDPMTGKDEWRIIHVGPGGQLTDSLVQKQQNPLGPNGQNGQNGQNAQNGQNGQQGSGSGFGSSGGSSFGSSGGSNSFGQSNSSSFGQSNSGNTQSNPGFGSGFGSQASNGSNTQQPPTQYNANGIPISGADADTSGGPPSGLNMAAARRHSDQMNLATVGQGQSGALNADPNDPNQSQDPNQPSDPNQNPNPNQNVNPNPNQNTAQQYPGQVNPGQPNPGQPGFPPGLPGQPGFAPGSPPGQNPNQANNPQNPALNAVQNSIFSARPGGFGGSSSSTSLGTGNSPGGGIGIAGVATKYKGPAIKVVNERKKYQEWEFVYDMKKDKSLLGAAGVNALNGQNTQQQGQQGSPGFSSFGNNSQNSSGSSFGSSGSSFGSGSTSQSQSGSQTQTQPQPQQQQQ